MTTPGQPIPGDVIGGGDLSPLAGLSEATWRNNVEQMAVGGYRDSHLNFGAVFHTMLSGFANVIDAIFATADNDYISQLPIIQEQQNWITDLVEAVERMILQGQSVIYDSNNTHYISDGVTSIDFIILGSGGGGGGWENPLIGSVTVGYGGAGGGEVHFSVPRSVFGDHIDIVVGAGGAGGSPGSPGGGGSPSKILTPDGEVAAGGGQGGVAVGVTNPAPAATGGAGMIPGGAGGRHWTSNNVPTSEPGGDSISQYSLHGGGGGGGAGTSRGGRGGLSAGGGGGQSGASADGIVATGGGGGGGGDGSNGGHGGFPSGGGGGGWRQSGTTGRSGGNGANGRVYVIERTT